MTAYLPGAGLLLVLDNLEQLPGAAAVIAELLAAAPGLVVLATSRRPLHLPGEHELPVRPLLVPAGGRAGGRGRGRAAARLFAQQAGMVRPGFEVTEGQRRRRRRDLRPPGRAAAGHRAGRLPDQAAEPPGAAGPLGHSLPLAAAEPGGHRGSRPCAPPSAWSYDLLAPDRGRSGRLGVFAGGCDLDALAAVAVTGGDPAAPTRWSQSPS